MQTRAMKRSLWRRHSQKLASCRLECLIRAQYKDLQDKLQYSNVKIQTQIFIRGNSFSLFKIDPGPVLRLSDNLTKTLHTIHMWVLIVQPSEAMHPPNVAWDVYNCPNHSSATTIALLGQGIAYNIRLQQK